MSEVFIPLGGAGGKNRGSTVYMDENYTHLKMGDTASMALPLPAGVYKKFKPERADDTLPESITSSGDGKNAVIVLEDKLLKKMTLEAFGIASITNFRLSMYAHRQVRLTWKNPSVGLWSGVRFVFKYGSMPADENDGFMVYDSADVHYETSRLEERELFVRAYSYVTVKDGRWYDEGAVSARITVTGISGSVTLSTGAGVWTVPDNVYKIRYIVVGQGGEGGNNSGWALGGAGGGGGYFASGYMDVNPEQKLSWIIPSAFLRSTVNTEDSSKYYRSEHLPQFDTVFGDVRVAHGKTQRTDFSYGRHSDEMAEYGGDGGSGGGCSGGRGGRNGSDGASGSAAYVSSLSEYKKYPFGGTGSHSSTTGFNGVLYCSGGDGGQYRMGGVRYDGTDGLGNGGSGEGGWERHASVGGKGGTGCIYIAWGSMMNDGS